MSETTILPGTAAPASQRVDQLLRLGLLVAALATGLLPLYRFIGSMIWFREYLGDYQVFWGIGSAPLEWVYGHYGFPYPPTALMLVRPFGMLPFWPSLVAWGMAGAAAIILAARRVMQPAAIALGFVTSAAVGVLAGGQVSLFIGALVMAGLSAASPRWRGALLAAAAVVKPQSLLPAPVALIAERNWRAIGWAIATAFALLLLSLLLFGVDTWIRWAADLHKFPTYLTSRGIDRGDVGVYGLARAFGLPGWTFVAGIPLGVATSWLVFRREAAPVDRYAAFAASTVLMSPYTLSYDLAGLTFASVAMLLDARRSPLIWLAAALIVSSVFANVGIILLAAMLSWEAVRR
ncbi:MAG TPA: glycosyltransferase family 87 protein [Sphingomicrobium sp.]